MYEYVTLLHSSGAKRIPVYKPLELSLWATYLALPVATPLLEPLVVQR